MSSIEKSSRMIRQLSLQPVAPRRQQTRRQRSADDEKSLQICSSPFARGKRGIGGKSGFDRPKVRVAWKENRSKNDKEFEEVEVVARQIQSRTKLSSAKSRAFVSTEKPTILYSRQELAERLRLAWKKREKNKTNINIFLACNTLGERCESALSGCTARENDYSLVENTCGNDLELLKDEEIEKLQISVDDDKGNCMRERNEIIQFEKSTTAFLKKDTRQILNKNDEHNFEHTPTEVKDTVQLKENPANTMKKERNKSEEKKTQSNEISENFDFVECFFDNKKETMSNIDCSKASVLSTPLPSIKIENSSMGIPKVLKEDLSSAKQKRAIFHSGTNKAFLEPIKPTMQCGWTLMSDKTQNLQRITIDNSHSSIEKGSSNETYPNNNETETIEKNFCENIVFQLNSNYSDEENIPRKVNANGKSISSTEKKCASTDDKFNEITKLNLRTKETVSTIINIKNANTTIDKDPLPRNLSNARCRSVNERNPLLKKTMEYQKTDQKFRRTNSAPPHRQSGISNNRVQISVTIDPPTVGKKKDQERVNLDFKDNATRRLNATSMKVTTNRSVRSAPSKRRSRSARRRFWSSRGNDENEGSRNRSAGCMRNSIDCRTIDIVTMVSLVSSADSDSDIENSPTDDKLINQLRNKLPTTSIIKSSLNSAFCNARRPTKSVSFQKDSFDEDSSTEKQLSPKSERKATQPRLVIVNQHGNGNNFSNEETLCLRTGTVNLNLPILTMLHNSEEQSTELLLTDREKRCLAVPIGDFLDKKRKLQKARSASLRSKMEKQTVSPTIKVQEPQKITSQKIEAPTEKSKSPTNNNPINVKSSISPPLKDTIQSDQHLTVEPRFQTTKEKECWHLYKKMCDNGVSVSFDTVLRGMLTPTEYRLRQRELSEN